MKFLTTKKTPRSTIDELAFARGDVVADPTLTVVATVPMPSSPSAKKKTKKTDKRAAKKKKTRAKKVRELVEDAAVAEEKKPAIAAVNGAASTSAKVTDVVLAKVEEGAAPAASEKTKVEETRAKKEPWEPFSEPRKKLFGEADSKTAGKLSSKKEKKTAKKPKAQPPAITKKAWQASETEEEAAKRTGETAGVGFPEHAINPVISPRRMGSMPRRLKAKKKAAKKKGKKLDAIKSLDSTKITTTTTPPDSPPEFDILGSPRSVNTMKVDNRRKAKTPPVPETLAEPNPAAEEALDAAVTTCSPCKGGSTIAAKPSTAAEKALDVAVTCFACAPWSADGPSDTEKDKCQLQDDSGDNALIEKDGKGTDAKASSDLPPQAPDEAEEATSVAADPTAPEKEKGEDNAPEDPAASQPPPDQSSGWFSFAGLLGGTSDKTKGTECADEASLRQDESISCQSTLDESTYHSVLTYNTSYSASQTTYSASQTTEGSRTTHGETSSYGGSYNSSYSASYDATATTDGSCSYATSASQTTEESSYRSGSYGSSTAEGAGSSSDRSESCTEASSTSDFKKKKSIVGSMMSRTRRSSVGSVSRSKASSKVSWKQKNTLPDGTLPPTLKKMDSTKLGLTLPSAMKKVRSMSAAKTTIDAATTTQENVALVSPVTMKKSRSEAIKIRSGSPSLPPLFMKKTRSSSPNDVAADSGSPSLPPLFMKKTRSSSPNDVAAPVAMKKTRSVSLASRSGSPSLPPLFMKKTRSSSPKVDAAGLSKSKTGSASVDESIKRNKAVRPGSPASQLLAIKSVARGGRASPTNNILLGHLKSQPATPEKATPEISVTSKTKSIAKTADLKTFIVSDGSTCPSVELSMKDEGREEEPVADERESSSEAESERRDDTIPCTAAGEQGAELTASLSLQSQRSISTVDLILQAQKVLG